MKELVIRGGNLGKESDLRERYRDDNNLKIIIRIDYATCITKPQERAPRVALSLYIIICIIPPSCILASPKATYIFTFCGFDRDRENTSSNTYIVRPRILIM